MRRKKGAIINNQDDNADNNGYSVLYALQAISDEKSFTLFKTIATLKSDSTILVSKLNITLKEYYSRMSYLREAGLIGKHDATYFLTSFGKIVYESVCLIEKAVSSDWKLKTIDSIKKSKELPHKEYNKVVNTLIEDNTVREILHASDEDFNNSHTKFCGTGQESS
jgi:hypothetical protein